MSRFNGECIECGNTTSLNNIRVCYDCHNDRDRDEGWLESLNIQQAKEFALENLTCYNDDNGYYLHIENGCKEDLYTLFSIIQNENEYLIEDAAEESGKYYNELYDNLCFKTEDDFKVFFNILINKIKVK